VAGLACFGISGFWDEVRDFLSGSRVRISGFKIIFSDVIRFQISSFGVYYIGFKVQI